MNAKQMIAKLDGYGGIIPFNSEELEVTLRALRLLAAAEGGEGTPETDAELATHKVIMENGGYCGTEPWSGLVTGRFARSLETQRNALAARVAELEKDAERYRWLESVAQPAYIAPASDIDTRMEWKLPTLISLTCINTEVSFAEAIDAARSKP